VSLKQKVLSLLGRKSGRKSVVGLIAKCRQASSADLFLSVEDYRTVDGEEALNLEVLGSREAPFPPYVHVGWVPYQWARGTCFLEYTREVDLDLLAKAHQQLRAWNEATDGLLLVDLRRETGNEGLLEVLEVL